MTTYEKVYWIKNQTVAGIDEVGRGCMAGPLVVVGLVLPINYDNPMINDSKTLSAKKREQLYDEIIEVALQIEVEVINEKTIDEVNIYQATKHAMEAITERMDADAILIDAMPISSDKDVQSIIKGDLKSISIAAASIVAKVIRDEIMEYLDVSYPHYGFKNHKGYVTKAHKEAMKMYGITSFHRKSFKPVSEYLILNKA